MKPRDFCPAGFLCILKQKMTDGAYGIIGTLAGTVVGAVIPLFIERYKNSKPIQFTKVLLNPKHYIQNEKLMITQIFVNITAYNPTDEIKWITDIEIHFPQADKSMLIIPLMTNHSPDTWNLPPKSLSEKEYLFQREGAFEMKVSHIRMAEAILHYRTKAKAQNDLPLKVPTFDLRFYNTLVNEMQVPIR